MDLLKEELGITTLFFNNLISTNDYAKENDIPDRCLIIAESQSGGRGRGEHSFFSPKGGIYFSYVRKYERPLDMQLLTVKAAVAVANALSEVCSIETKIKWVNDIYLDNKKICGILCENIADKNIVGIGINSFDLPFPEELAEKAGTITVPDKEALITCIIENLEFLPGGERLLESYEKRALLNGKTISFFYDGKTKTGKVCGVTSRGYLIVDTADEVLTLFGGEVSVI